MNDPVEPAAPTPDPASPTRRRMLHAATRLGLAAAGVATLGVADAAGADPVEPLPDEPGRFLQPPSAEALRRQRLRTATSVGSQAPAKPGVIRVPEPTSAPGVRLRPSRAVIDATPLALRPVVPSRPAGRG